MEEWKNSTPKKDQCYLTLLTNMSCVSQHLFRHVQCNLDQSFRDRNCCKIWGLQVLGSSSEIGLCWYKKGTNYKWINDLLYHLVLDFKTTIAVTFMWYVVDLDAYELHLGDEKSSMTFLMNASVVHYTYDREILEYVTNAWLGTLPPPPPRSGCNL